MFHLSQINKFVYVFVYDNNNRINNTSNGNINSLLTSYQSKAYKKSRIISIKYRMY